MDLLAFPSLLFLLSCIGCCAGQNIQPPGPVQALLGSNVTLKTMLYKPDYSFIIWKFNNGNGNIPVATVAPTGLKVTLAQYQGRVAINQTNGYLSLGPLQSADSGDYEITMVSPDGEAPSEEVKLRVLEPLSTVTIQSDRPEAIELNNSVVLNCSAKCSFIKFTWINGSTPIVADSQRLTLKEGPTSSLLTIRDVLRTDLVGPIYCSATNGLQTQSSAPFNLTVHYGPELVTISPSNPAQYLQSGSSFNLSCSARSSLPATFSWYQNQQLIQAAGPVLTLDMIEKQGLGNLMNNYSCRATNSKTQRSVPSPVVFFAVIKAISGTTITGPTATLIAGNSTANLSCQATAGTMITRYWRKKGEELSSNARLVFTEDKSSLMINPLQKEDHGEYTCHLKNPVSSDQASYKMVVNYGPEQVTVLGKNVVKVDNNVTLVCSADSVPPANFTWMFNDTATNTKVKTFTIVKATYQSAGTYKCEAFNAVTGRTSTSSYILSVKDEDDGNPGGTSDGTSGGLSDGAIAGIIIGVLVAVAAAIGLIVYCRQKVPCREPGPLEVESPY